MLKKDTKHTGHTQLQLGYHYKTADFKNQRGKRMRELIIETQRYDSSDVVFSMYLIIETKYICQKQDKQHNE